MFDPEFQIIRSQVGVQGTSNQFAAAGIKNITFHFDIFILF